MEDHVEDGDMDHNEVMRHYTEKVIPQEIKELSETQDHLNQVSKHNCIMLTSS